MKLKRSTRSCDRGVTLIELLVASGMGVALMGLALTTFLSNRRIVKYDLERTSVQQNLRSAVDLIGMNVRLAGENFSSQFPAIEVIDGGTDSDELIIRRNLFDEVLKLCIPLTTGFADDPFFAIAGTTPGCIYTDQAQNFLSWQSHRLSLGGEALGYIFDPSTNLGEFFKFNGELDSGVDMSLDLSPGESWDNNYSAAQTAMYILEDWRFARGGELLQLFENGDTLTPINIVHGIEAFSVEVTMEDNTVRTSFGVSDDWTKIKSIDVSLRTNQRALGKVKERTITASFFPRNVLSN